MFLEECDIDSLQGMFMKIAHLYFRKTFQQLGNTGIHPGQLPMLTLLSTEEGLSQSEISKRLHIKPPTVAVSIKRLEKVELVERKEDEKDQRISRIYLTKKGQDIIRETKDLVKENERLLFEGFHPDEIILLKGFFQQMLDNLDDIAVDETKGKNPC